MTLPQSDARNFLLVAAAKRDHNRKDFVWGNANEYIWKFTTSRIASPFFRQSRPVFNLFLISLGFAPLPGPACNILQMMSLSILNCLQVRSSQRITTSCIWLSWCIAMTIVDCDLHHLFPSITLGRWSS